MNFDPTVLEALVAALLTVLGAGAGLRLRHRGGGGDGEGAGEGPLAQQLAELGAKVAELGAKVDRLAGVELERIDERARQQQRAHQRLAGDFDAVADALDVLVTESTGHVSRRSTRAGKVGQIADD